MATISGDALWYIIRKDSAFAKRNRAYGGQNFTVDPFAVNGYNQKRSSVVSDKAVGVSLNKDGHIVIRVKSSNNKPAGVSKVVKRAGYNAKATVVAHTAAKTNPTVALEAVRRTNALYNIAKRTGLTKKFTKKTAKK